MTALSKDLSHLPKAQPGTGAAWAPDKEIRFGQLVIERFHRQANDNLPTAVAGARFRHSNAGACSRKLAYIALGIPVSNPVDAVGHFAMHLGSYVHDEWQQELRLVYGTDAEIEVKVGSGDRAGHIDAVVRQRRDHEAPVGSRLWAPEAGHPDYVTAIEAKTVGGYAFKKAVGIPPAGRTPFGPGYDHVIQASLNGKEVDADEVVIIYWGKEAVSHGIAQGRGLTLYQRGVAEWTLTRDQYMEIAEREIARVDAILALVDDGVLPKRKIPTPELPARHVITNPTTGEWVSTNEHGTPEDAGTFWACAYCSHQATCSETPAGRTPIAEVPVLVELLKDQ
jgi:hypothetical protein